MLSLEHPSEWTSETNQLSTIVLRRCSSLGILDMGGLVLNELAKPLWAHHLTITTSTTYLMSAHNLLARENSWRVHSPL